MIENFIKLHDLYQNCNRQHFLNWKILVFAYFYMSELIFPSNDLRKFERHPKHAHAHFEIYSDEPLASFIVISK